MREITKDWKTQGRTKESSVRVTAMLSAPCDNIQRPRKLTYKILKGATRAATDLFSFAVVS